VADPTTPASAPLEAAVVRTVPWLLGGLAASVLALFVPGDVAADRAFLVQLSALAVLALVVATRIAPLFSGRWYANYQMSDPTRRLAGGISLVVVTTGVIGLVTLASSAALRLAPSVQFLQLLSALDIAWVVAATLIGAQHLWGRTAGIAAGAVLAALCVASITNYLRVAGFTADGEWIPDGSELTRLVIPADVLAATVAIVILILAARRG
jgi:hypothetical protein